MTKGQTTIFKITTRKTKDRATGTRLKTRGKSRSLLSNFDNLIVFQQDTVLSSFV
jgi:hypothetical protein